MEQKERNWHVWIGFSLCIVGFLSYPFFFARYPITRDVPWANFLILAAGLVFAFSGLRRAFGKSQEYKGKIAGPILGVLSVAVVGFFVFAIFFATKLPKSAEAPKVGEKAPEFALVDVTKQQVSLASLFAAPMPGTQKPPKGVFLVFYRGYW
jgi:hypothetical protein